MTTPKNSQYSGKYKTNNKRVQPLHPQEPELTDTTHNNCYVIVNKGDHKSEC